MTWRDVLDFLFILFLIPVTIRLNDSKAKQIRDSRSDERTGQARTTYQKSRAQSERKVRAEEGIDLKETYL